MSNNSDFQIKDGVLIKYTGTSRKVVIPDGVTRIRDRAFGECDRLVSVTIPSSVTSIGYGVFSDCKSLTSIVITDLKAWLKIHFSNYWIDTYYNLFLGNDRVTKLTIPDNMTSIGNYVFYKCKSLTSVTIPDSVTSIGKCTFCDCESLISIVITDLKAWLEINFSDYWIDSHYDLFLGNDKVTKLTIPDDVNSVGNYGFYHCTSLTSITVPDSVTSIGDSAFMYCTSLTSIIIPDSVTSIENGAFSYCKSLTSITIPDSVTSIGNGAFSYCKSLTSITIPDGVTSIGESAFMYCTSLTSITIPDSVTSIGDSAFMYCTSLTSIMISDSVTNIEWQTFYGCSRLTSIIIPEGVTSIGRHAFSGCTSLTNITIPKRATNIGKYAFYGCQNVKIAVSGEEYFVVAGCDKWGEDIVAVIKILQTGKMDPEVKIPLNLKFQLAVKLIDWYDNADAKAYVKKMLTKGVKSLIDSGNLGLIQVLLEKTDLITKKNIDKFIQYAIDTKQQEIYLTLIHHKDEIGAYTEISKKFRL